jgi:putative flippase GtrA
MEKVKQFSKYGGVAAGSAFFDYTVFTALLFSGVGAVPAQMVARIAGGVLSFIVNKYWSFGNKKIGGLKTEGRRFLVLYIFSYFLSLAILYLLIEQFEIKPYPAKISADITCFVVNFLVMRGYVFSDNRGLRYGIRKLFGASGKTS